MIEKTESVVMSALWYVTKGKADHGDINGVVKEWRKILEKHGWSWDEWQEEVHRVNAILETLPEGFKGDRYR